MVVIIIVLRFAAFFGLVSEVRVFVLTNPHRSRRKRTHHINEAPFHVTAQETEKQHIKLTDVKASTDVATLDATRQDAMDGSVEQDMGEKLLPPDASVTSSREEVPDEEGTIPDPPNNSSSSSSGELSNPLAAHSCTYPPAPSHLFPQQPGTLHCPSM